MSSAWFLVLAAGLLNSVGAFFLKKSHLTATSHIFGLPFSIYLVAGGGMLAITFVLYVFSLKTLPVSVAYPVFVAVSQAVLTVLALSVLSERLTALQVVGILAIIVGTIIVAITTRVG